MSRGYRELALALVGVVAPTRRSPLVPAPRPAPDDQEPTPEAARPRQARRTYAPGVDWLGREFPTWDVRLVGVGPRMYVATRGADMVRAHTVGEAVEEMLAVEALAPPSPVRPYLSR